MTSADPARVGGNAAFVLAVAASALTLCFARWCGDRTGIYLGLGALTGLAVAFAARARFDIRHPAVWFGLGFWLYSIASPVLYLLGHEFGPSRAPASRVHALILEYYALAAFCVAVGSQVRKFRFARTEGLSTLSRGSAVVLVTSFGMSVAYLYAFYRFGVTSKFDRTLSASYLLRTDFFFTFLIVAFSAYATDAMNRYGRPPRKAGILLAVYLLVAFLISGERDLMFRFLLTLAFWQVTFTRVRNQRLYGGLAAAIVASTLMGAFKNVLLAGNDSRVTAFDRVRQTLTDVPRLFLGSEFRTAGDNLSLLVDWVPSSIPHLYGRSTWWETSSLFALGFARGRDESFATADWFARSFYADFYHRGGGMGFTLVGQGYLDWGAPGVIALFAAVGLFIRFLYRHAARDPVMFLAYINAAPIVLYSVRGTTATMFSPTLKHIVVPLALMYVIGLRKSSTRPLAAPAPSIRQTNVRRREPPRQQILPT